MSTANITVSVTEPVITVSSDLANVTVTSPVSNIVVGTTAFASNADIRSAISLINSNSGPGLTYNQSTGVFTYSLYAGGGIDINADGSVSTDSTVLRTGTTVTGDVGVTGTLTATYLAGDGSNITGVSTLTNAQAKAYIEGTGLDATANLNTTANASATYFIGDGSQLTGVDSNADVKAYIEGTGLNATANLNTTANVSGAYILGDGSQLTGIDGNADVKTFIESTGLAMTSAITSNSNITTTANVNSASFNTTGNATVGANLNVSGDLEVTGNINYREVTDLLVQDQTITLNYGNASAQDAQIIVDRSGSALANVDLKWNETADEWQFTNDGTVYGSIGSSLFTGDTLTLRSGEINPGNADIVVDTGSSGSISGNAFLGWRDFGNGKGNWQANFQNANVAGQSSGSIGNVVIAGGSGTFLEAALNSGGFGMQKYTGDIGKNDFYTGEAPSQIFVRNTLYTNAIASYDTSDGLITINDNGTNDDAIDINIVLRTTNDAGALNSSGMTIYGSQALTGPGSGGLIPIVSYDGMGNVSTYLDRSSKDNANTNTNHFTIHGIGDNDPVFKVNQNSDITIGGVTTSDSNITTSANVSADYTLSNSSVTGTNIIVGGKPSADGNIKFYANTFTNPFTDISNKWLNQGFEINRQDQYPVSGSSEIGFESLGQSIGYLNSYAWYDTATLDSTNDVKWYKGSGSYPEVATSPSPTDGLITAGDILQKTEWLAQSGQWSPGDFYPWAGGIAHVVYQDNGISDPSAGSSVPISMEWNINPLGAMQSSQQSESVNKNVMRIKSDRSIEFMASQAHLPDGTDGTANATITESGNISTLANITASGNIVAGYFHGDGSNITGIAGDIESVTAGIGLSGGGTTGAVTLNLDPTVTTIAASGNGSLIYDNTSGVFTDTPADTSLATKTTTDLAEGTNLYFTDARVQTKVANLTGNVVTSANVSASHFIGDGSALTNLPTQPDLDTGNIYVGNANVTVQVTPSTNFVTQVTTTGSTTFSIESITPFQNGTINVDGVTFVGGQIYSDGLEVVISGLTAGGATALNGLTFYLKWTSNDGGLYELYDNVGLTTASQRATGGYIGSTTGIITYSGGTIITPTFALADTVTVANVQLTNQLQSSAGANLNINSNTKSVVFKKDFLSATDTAQIELDAEGWAVSAIDYPNGTPPVYSGSAERVAWVIEGTATAGSKVINVTTAEEWGLAYGTNNFNGTAPSTAGRTSMFTGSNPIANNYVSRTKGSVSVGQTPFPSGSIIESFDSAANTITMSQPADVNATFAWNSGGQAQSLYTLVSGAYNNDVGVTFGYYSNYDFDQLGAPDNSKVTLIYAEVNSYDKYGFGPTGPSASDLTYSIGTSSEYTKPSYGMRGRMALNGEKSFLNTNYGMNIGEGAVTNRIVADQFTGYGIAQIWDGTLDYNTLFGSSSLIPQIGYRQFTDGIAQNGSPHLGPRFQFMSSKGNVNDPSSEWYPRTGQELGRMGFWGSHGDLPNASSTSQPAYISVQAADDWTTGSNASVYHVGTSDYSSQYRMPFMSFEKGNLILASGLNNGAQESVHFAPGRSVTNNPANAYDFNTGATGTTGWASINYENVGGQTGAELSVNNGGSLGAGTVGDMAVSMHRNDNSYSANVTSTANSNGLIYNGTGSGLTADIFVFTNNPPLTTLPDATPVTAAGFTGYFAPINGQVLYTQKVFGGQYILLYEDVSLTIPVKYIPSGVGYTQDPGSLEYTVSATSGVTDRKWKLELAEQSEDLVIKTTSAVPTTSTVMTFKESEILANKQMRSDITNKGTAFVSGDTITLGTADLNTITAGIATSGAGTITVDVAALGVAATGGIWKVEVTNSSGAAQTIATSNAVTNVSQSVADGGKILLVLHSVGTTVYAGYFV